MEIPFTQGRPELVEKAQHYSEAFYGMAGRGASAPGAVVIRELGNESAANYVVHFFNSQDGGYYSGDYCATLGQAYEVFGQRIQRYDRDGELNKRFDPYAVPV